MKNKTILQNFEWYLPNDCDLWNRTAQRAEELKDLGITDVWMPPAYKGLDGTNDVGYGVYDLYDLGEFDQKGTVRTKYGTKDAYLGAIRALQSQGMRVIGDIVLNHRMGGDGMEHAIVCEMFEKKRLKIKKQYKEALVDTLFTFPGRDGKYSDFTWNKTHFNAVDRNYLKNPEGAKGIMKLSPAVFNLRVDDENGNYDYLMGCNHNLEKVEVVEELIRWGEWYMDFTGLDGVRLDAVKHMDFTFFGDYWLPRIRARRKDMFAVGEYWNGDVKKLLKYLKHCRYSMSLFDVALHYNLHKISKDNENEAEPLTMDKLLVNTLVDKKPEHAVTFVDNHDTQENQPLYSWVKDWFKPHAYATILLRKDGVPCVFYGDIYGVPSQNHPEVPGLRTMMKARQRFAYGEQKDYFDHPNTVGWTRRGSQAGDMAVVMTNGSEGWKDMELGKPGEVYVDLLGNRHEEITIGQNGEGRFTVNSRSISIWVRKDQAYV